MTTRHAPPQRSSGRCSTAGCRKTTFKYLDVHFGIDQITSYQSEGSSDQRLGGLNEKLKTTAREVSRLDTLIAHGAVRLCGEKKYLMDVIKITARNLFYELLAPFKAAYDNFRDDHVWFRHLTRRAGLIEPVAGAGRTRSAAI